MRKINILVIRDSVVEQTDFNLEEFCRACGVDAEIVQEAIEFGVIELEEIDLEYARFDSEHLRRMRAALRLHHDLEINLAGAALVLNLMDEVERLRAQVELYERRMFL